VLTDAISFVGVCRVAENLHRAQELLEQDVDTQTALRTLGTTGFVVHTVAAAAYCFLKTPEDFERTVIDAVMGGEDADTTAAVAGGISGAYNGVGAIPDRWRRDVERCDEIEALARDLWRVTAEGTVSAQP
jgi:ADP-ribosylglycohydrolase